MLTGKGSGKNISGFLPTDPELLRKAKERSSLKRGYTAEMTDCKRSFKQWDTLNAINIGNAILRTGWVWLCTI